MRLFDWLRRLRPDPRAHAETVATLIDQAACERERARRAMRDWERAEAPLWRLLDPHPAAPSWEELYREEGARRD